MRSGLIDPDRAADHVHRGLRLSPLQCNDAEMMQAGDVVAIDRKNLAVLLLGFEQLSRPMMLHCQRENRRNSWRTAQQMLANLLSRRAFPRIAGPSASSPLLGRSEY